MKITLAAIGAAATLALAPSVQAQDITGALAGALDQFGQSLGESATAGESIFVSAVGETLLPGGAPMAQTVTLSIDGTGDTAVAAAKARDEIVAKVQAVARRFGVSAEVGKSTFAFGEAWAEAAIDWDAFDFDSAGDAAAEATAAAVDAAGAFADLAEATRTFTASSEITIDRPADARMAGFVDALAEAGVPSFSESSLGFGEAGASALGMWASLLGIEMPADPGEGVWGAATADAIAKARTQAQQVATASGRPLGQVKNVTVFLRHQDGQKAYVTVSVRFGFAD